MSINMKSLNGYGFDAAALGGKAPEYYLQPRNLLDNSYWENPKEVVNQRGETSKQGDWVYWIDRWQVNASNAAISLVDGGIRVPAQASKNQRLVQRIPLEKIQKGRAYTIAVCESNGTVRCASGIYNGNITGDGNGDNLIYVTLQDGDGSTFYYFIVDCYKDVVLKWAALYEGSYTADTLPPYVPKGYAAELEECRSYLPFAINAGEGEYRSIGTGAALSESDIKINIPLPTSPRAVPNISCNDITALMLRGASYITPTNISLDIYSMNSITITCTVSGAVAGGAYELIATPGLKLLMTSEL